VDRVEAAEGRESRDEGMGEGLIGVMKEVMTNINLRKEQKLDGNCQASVQNNYKNEKDFGAFLWCRGNDWKAVLEVNEHEHFSG